MNILVNGEKVLLQQAPISVAEYCTQNAMNIERIVMEYNGEILKKEAYPQTMLKENDVLEIITFVAGG